MASVREVWPPGLRPGPTLSLILGGWTTGSRAGLPDGVHQDSRWPCCYDMMGSAGQRVNWWCLCPRLELIHAEKIYGRKPSCPFRKSYPDVLVVQSSQDRNGDNGARSLDCSMQGRIFL